MFLDPSLPSAGARDPRSGEVGGTTRADRGTTAHEVETRDGFGEELGRAERREDRERSASVDRERGTENDRQRVTPDESEIDREASEDRESQRDLSTAMAEPNSDQVGVSTGLPGPLRPALLPGSPTAGNLEPGSEGPAAPTAETGAGPPRSALEPAARPGVDHGVGRALAGVPTGATGGVPSLQSAAGTVGSALHPVGGEPFANEGPAAKVNASGGVNHSGPQEGSAHAGPTNGQAGGDPTSGGQTGGGQAGDHPAGQPGSAYMSAAAFEPDPGPLVVETANADSSADTSARVERASTTPGPVVDTRTEGVAATVRARPQTLAPPPEGADNTVRVLHQFRTHIAGESREATLHLVPANLGRMSIRIRMQRGRLEAHLRVESPETLAGLERHLPELKASLAQEGIEAEHVVLELDVGNESGGQRSSEKGAHGPLPAKGRDAALALDVPAATARAHTPHTISDTRIDTLA